jgi:hypothetical protein
MSVVPEPAARKARVDAAPRIALIHALFHSIAPVNATRSRGWTACA